MTWQRQSNGECFYQELWPVGCVTPSDLLFPHQCQSVQQSKGGLLHMKQNKSVFLGIFQASGGKSTFNRHKFYNNLPFIWIFITFRINFPCTKYYNTFPPFTTYFQCDTFVVTWLQNTFGSDCDCYECCAEHTVHVACAHIQYSSVTQLSCPVTKLSLPHPGTDEHACSRTLVL